MKIVCLGSGEAQAAIDATNARYSLTSTTSQKMVDFFNSKGGNTPMKDIFDSVRGILNQIETIASPTPKPVHVVKTPSPPLFVFAGIGLVAFVLYKAVK